MGLCCFALFVQGHPEEELGKRKMQELTCSLSPLCTDSLKEERRKLNSKGSILIRDALGVVPSRSTQYYSETPSLAEGILFAPAWNTGSLLGDLGGAVFEGTTVLWMWHCRKRQKEEIGRENTINFPRRKNGRGRGVESLFFK